ncbi:uncharacterized protein LOC117315231 [Pecten maximus]|uniref:uncharacterized protein LOC117315231 n=1 Tax=Pecten maximus TaxID=6579 RepID=UPI0014589843|nr:uncharacterized protein LOC117315231 [Pecten maximus]
MENGNLYTYGPDRNLLVDLQAHEVYQIQSSSDLTAVVVKSNNTVACFAGANQTMLANDGKEDHIVSALPPTQAWGYEYILAGTESPNFQDIVKIVATEDNTIVDVDSCTHKTFNLAKAFDYVEDPLTCGGYAIHSNFKIVVAHIRIKDNPGMFFPFPTSIFASHYTVYVPNTNVGAHVSSVILYAKTNDIGLIIFNGTLLSTSGWSPILNSEWSYKSVAVDAGLLNIHNNFKKSFGGHLLVVNAFKLSVMNLIPAPYNTVSPLPDMVQGLCPIITVAVTNADY